MSAAAATIEDVGGVIYHSYAIAVARPSSISYGVATPCSSPLFIRDDGKRMLGFARDEKNKIVSVTGGSWRVADRL